MDKGRALMLRWPVHEDLIAIPDIHEQRRQQRLKILKRKINRTKEEVDYLALVD